jgi:hypothetical protein
LSLPVNPESEAVPRPEVKIKKKVSFKEVVTVKVGEDGVATAEDLKGSPVHNNNSGLNNRGLNNSSSSNSSTEEVTMIVDVASLGNKGSPSYVRHNNLTKLNTSK